MDPDLSKRPQEGQDERDAKGVIAFIYRKKMGSEMNITTMGIDLAKNVFNLVGMDNSGHVIFKKKVSRAHLTRTFLQLPPCLVAMEACGSSHWSTFWGVLHFFLRPYYIIHIL